MADKINKIYTLRDPITYQVEYVGMTAGTLQARLEQHIRSSKVNGHLKKGARDRWISQLERRGLQPVIELLETVTGDWQERERYWIQYYNVYKEDGGDLTNATIGGRGVIRKVGDPKP